MIPVFFEEQQAEILLLYPHIGSITPGPGFLICCARSYTCLIRSGELVGLFSYSLFCSVFALIFIGAIILTACNGL